MRTIKAVWKLGAVGAVVAASLLLVLPHSEATFPGTNGQIAWVTGSNLFVARPDGSQVRPMGAGDNPAWSADGVYLAFDRQDDVYQQLANNTAVTNLTPSTPSIDIQPAFSPDGTKIAFASNRSGQFRIWQMNADGTSPVAVTSTGSLPSGSQDAFPDWSPDGQRIAFARGVPDEGQDHTAIFSAKADGTDLQRLTGTSAPGGGAYDTLINPRWSPGGSKITFGVDGGCVVYTMNSNGSSPGPLPNNNGCATDPTYSPDGTLVLFRLEDGPQGSGLYGFRPSANEMAQLVNDGGATSPDWQALDGPAPSTTSTSPSTSPTTATTTTTTTLPPAPANASKPLVVRSGTWYLRDSLTTGTATSSYGYGNPTDKPVTGDWDGNGSVTAGVVRDGTWYLRNAAGGDTADVPAFGYGNPGDVPVTGDWDHNGSYTPGVVRDGVWYLRNSLTTGVADVTFGYGNASGDIPITGDWNGDGTFTVGVVRDGTWYLRNASGGGVADVDSFGYGNGSGDIPITGDWNGDGTFTVGVVRDGTWYLRNAGGGGVADIPAFVYGNASGDKPLVWRP